MMPLGAPGAIVENEWCRVDLEHTTITTVDSHRLTFNIPIQFKPAFKGRQILAVEAFPADYGVVMGDWLAAVAAPGLPTGSVNLGAATTEGSKGVYVSASDTANGYRYMTNQHVAIVPASVVDPLSTPNICLIHYQRRFNDYVELRNDSNTAWLSSTNNPGYVENSQCRVETWQFAVAAVPSTNTVNWNTAVRLKAPYRATGAKVVRLELENRSFGYTSWMSEVSWGSDPVGGNEAPFVDAIDPGYYSACNAGLPEVVTAAAEDPNGATDVKQIELMINDQPDWNSGACWVLFDIPTNTIKLADGLNHWLGSIAAYPGTGSVSYSSYCTLRATQSRVTTSPDGKTVSASFDLDVGGVRNTQIFARATDAAGRTSLDFHE